MKVLMLNGSPKANGNTAIALKEMERVFAEEGIEVVTVQVGNQPVRGCIACGGCSKTGKCVLTMWSTSWLLFLRKLTVWWWAALSTTLPPTQLLWLFWIACFTARLSRKL